MNKVFIEIYIPAIGEHYDIFVPVDIPIQDLTRVIINGIVEITNGRYVTSQSEHLCIKEPVGLLNPMLTLYDYGVIDGTEIYLV